MFRKNFQAGKNSNSEIHFYGFSSLLIRTGNFCRLEKWEKHCHFMLKNNFKIN